MLRAVAKARSLPATAAAPPRPAPDLSRLMGVAAWVRLPIVVRRRFALNAGALPVTYRGSMAMRATAIGRAFTLLARCLGLPLVAWRGASVTVDVHVAATPDHAGTEWTRVYHRAGRGACVQRSSKCLDEHGHYIEDLRHGWRMHLRVAERAGALVFIAERYSFGFGRWRWPVPAWASPGCTEVVHRDLGGGEFTYELRIVHPRWGVIIEHGGVFTDPRN